MDNVKDLYAQITERRLAEKMKRLDAAGIVFNTGDLEAVEQTVYETIFSPRDSLSNIPVSSEYNPAVTSITYEVATRTGVANTLHRDADDRARADVSLARFSAVVHEGGASYDYNVDNGNIAQLTGFDLASERAKAAALMIAEWHDKVALTGHDTGATGFVNNADVAVAKAKQTWTAGSTTGATMFNDVAGCINKIPEGSDGAHKANTCALSIGVWNALAITRFDTTSAFTVLEKLRANYPMVNFVQWAALKDKAAAGGDHRIVAYEKAPTNMVYRATVIYDEDLPVRGNFKFNVACRGRAAGVTVRYPLAMKYQDIALSGW